MTSTLEPVRKASGDKENLNVVDIAAMGLSTVGAGLQIPLVTGHHTDYANMDHAASAPCLEAVRQAVEEFLPWYASVHRGAGLASKLSTQIYENARLALKRFVDARAGDTVIFTRNTTDSFNLLARCMPRSTSVVVFETEHHATLLPWPAASVVRIPMPRSELAAIDAVDLALSRCRQGPRLVVLAGASNVTGELLPVREIAAVARRNGARIAVDAAQLAPHRRVSLREYDVDYIALSGHKLYAPFGAGAVIGRADWLRAAQPYLAGGGATKLVQESAGNLNVVWNSGPERHEAGSPNTVGAYALSVACEVLGRHRDELIKHESALFDSLLEGLSRVRGLTQLRFFDTEVDRVATVSFLLEDYEPGWVAAVLSAEYGIGVRDGAFCAHIATKKLISQAGSQGQQAIRVSLGLGSTAEHVDRLVNALNEITLHGARWTYALEDGRWTPTPDPRKLPNLAGLRAG